MSAGDFILLAIFKGPVILVALLGILGFLLFAVSKRKATRGVGVVIMVGLALITLGVPALNGLRHQQKGKNFFPYPKSPNRSLLMKAQF